MKVTVVVGMRTMNVDDVKDARISSALKAAGKDVGEKLAKVKCPEHDQTATNIRVHFDNRGAADLKYDSCCEKLGKKIASALG